jgi:hypothetical protein
VNKIVIAAATGLIAITAAVGVAASASAATPTPSAPKHTLAQVQSSSATKTDKLIAHIEAVETRVNASTKLTADQKSTVEAALAADVQAVQTGAAKVAADTAVKDAAKDSRETLRAGRASLREQVAAVRADLKADHAAKNTPSS